MKYIIIESKMGGLTRSTPIIFPNGLSHSDVAKAIIETCPEVKNGTIISAGEISSLAMKDGRPGDQDAELIYMLDYTHGIE